MDRIGFRELDLEAFVHATESRERVEGALLHVAPGARVERQALRGHFGQPLLVLRARLRDPPAVESAVRRLAESAGAELARTLARRVDEQGRFFARLDKQAAAAGTIALSDSTENDVIRWTARVRAPGRGRADVLAALEALLRGGATGSMGSTGGEEE
ncbi:MAG TPA: RNA-binding domain-containing protein [Candidatus Thermoplasmatota archaeon]